MLRPGSARCPSTSCSPGLDRSLELLTEGERDLPVRQQTLRSAIAWSENLLVDDERALFRTVAVFAGGMSPAAVAAVHGVTTEAAASLLDSLVEMSLLRHPHGDRERYVVLEPIRQFAEERLALDGDAIERVRDAARGVVHGVGGGPRTATDRRRPGGRAAGRLRVDHDNFRAALERTAPDQQVRLAAALCRYWIYGSHWHEGRRALETALGTGAGAPLDRANARLGLGNIALQQGDIEIARAVLEAGIYDAREAGDRGAEAALENALGIVERATGDLDRAGALWEGAARDRRVVGRPATGSPGPQQPRPARVRSRGRRQRRSRVGCGRRQPIAISATLRPRSPSSTTWPSLPCSDRTSRAQSSSRGAPDSLAEGMGNRSAMAAAALTLSGSSASREDYEAARTYASDAVTLAEADGNLAVTARALTMLSPLCDEMAVAVRVARRALGIYRAIGDDASADGVRGWLDELAARAAGATA